MQFSAMVTAFAVALAAVGAGVWQLLGFGGFAAFSLLGVLAGGAVAGWKCLQFLGKLMEMVEGIYEASGVLVEKATYMERRMDSGGGKLGEVCRHLMQDMQGYRPAVGPKVWLERRCRAHFEAFAVSNCGASEGLDKVQHLWSLVCAEAKLQSWRDFVAARAYGEPSAADEADMQSALQNMNRDDVAFWSPCSIEDILKMRGKACRVMEHIVLEQLVERVEELKYYKNQSPAAFAGIDMEGI